LQRLDNPFDGLPQRHFACIAVDAPMQFKPFAPPRADQPERRDVERHYPTMSFAELAALPIASLAAPAGCNLFQWTSPPHLLKSIELMAAWRFAFTWARLRRGFDPYKLTFIAPDFAAITGLTTRKNSEVVLLGRRGNPRRYARDVNELIISPVREHSPKPEEFFRRVERYCDGPRLELFARKRRLG
jgi:N6-adenosine-specific RNA methylase IME4